jgi:hypothetical protein
MAPESIFADCPVEDDREGRPALAKMIGSEFCTAVHRGRTPLPWFGL